MNEIEITVRGNVTSDVELRSTQTGKALALFTVASAERNLDRTTGIWADGETAFLAVKCWNTLATNVADSLGKGMPVIVQGRLNAHRFERELGDRMVSSTRFEITAYAVGHDLARGVAEFRRTKSQAVHRAEQRALTEAGMPASAVAADGGPTWGGGA